MSNFYRENSKYLLILAFKRAVWTAVEVSLAIALVDLFRGLKTGHFYFLNILIGTFVISFLKSIVIGVPEFKNDGILITGGKTSKVNLSINNEKLKKKAYIRLRVINDRRKKARKEINFLVKYKR